MKIVDFVNMTHDIHQCVCMHIMCSSRCVLYTRTNAVYKRSDFAIICKPLRLLPMLLFTFLIIASFVFFSFSF